MIITNPIKLVSVCFVDGANYQVEDTFEDIVSKLNDENNLIINFTLPNGQKIAAMKNTISRIITA